MATTNEKNDPVGRVFTTPTGRALQAELAAALNEKAWKDAKHPRHLSQVTKIYNIYRKLHGSK